MEEGGPILLFDGVCNFCNGSVNFVIDHDRTGRFRFASLQSESGRALLRAHGLSDLPLSTMVLIDAGKAYTGSDGVLRTARCLGGPFRLLWAFELVPRALRDPLYRAVARRRYRLFGKSEQCRVPAPDIRARFLDAPRVEGAPNDT
jgi:predicted DCC family thiol-disulfide oxidoreductase YuxK